MGPYWILFCLTNTAPFSGTLGLFHRVAVLVSGRKAGFPFGSISETDTVFTAEAFRSQSSLHLVSEQLVQEIYQITPHALLFFFQEMKAIGYLKRYKLAESVMGGGQYVYQSRQIPCQSLNEVGSPKWWIKGAGRSVSGGLRWLQEPGCGEGKLGGRRPQFR